MSLSIAQGFNIFATCYSAFMWINYKPLWKLFGVDPSPRLMQLYRVKATVYLSFNVIAGCLLFPNQFPGSNHYHAMTAGYLPWIIQVLRSIFIEKDHKAPVNLPLPVTLPPLILAPFFLYGYAKELPLAPILYGVNFLINGVSAALAPDFHTKAWGCSPDEDVYFKTSIRTLGFSMCALGTLVLAVQLLDISPAQAYGYAMINLLGSLLIPLLDSNEKIAKFRPLMLAWVPLVASVLYATLGQ